MPPKPSAPAGTQQNNPNAITPSSSSAPPTAQLAATILPGVGSIDLLNHTVPPDPLPALAEDGIYRTQLTPIGQAPSEGEFFIMSNYVKITAMPKKLWAYSLKFWRRHPTDESRTIDFNKKREIGGAFNALLHEKVVSLKEEEKNWATNFKELWTSVPLAEHSEGPDGWESPPFKFMQLNGKEIDDMRVTIKFDKTYDDIEQAMREKHIMDLSDHVRALNAHVSQSAMASARTGRLTQIGANKFYINGSFAQLTQGTSNGLLALRGYYTSVRPTKAGALLNINTMTSAFLPAITVDKFVAAMGLNEAERLLKGSIVRIAYLRRENDEKNMNCEEARRKVFQHFGLGAAHQKFYKVLEKDKKDKKSKRRIATNDIGRTVAEYLTTDALVDLNLYSGDGLLCVNVGKKTDRIVEVKRNDQMNHVNPVVQASLADQEAMRKQSLDGAVWIPACLLEILPNQAVHGLLSAKDTAEMIKQAVRLPAANAGRIVEEGLKILGVKPHPGQSQNKQLGHMGIQLDDKLISLAARSLKMPSVYYGQPTDTEGNVRPGVNPNEPIEKTTEDVASWNIRDIGFATSQGLASLHVLGLKWCFQRWQAHDDRGRDAALENIQKELLTKIKCSDMPGYLGHRQRLTVDLEEWHLKSFWKEAAMYDCTLVLLKEKDYDIYSMIKRKGDLECGQHTVCAIASKTKNTEKANANLRSQYLANLTLKINMKMEGENHFPDQVPLDKILGEERHRTIILGADVTHPGVGSKLGYPSIACVVGNVDKHFMNYPGSMRLQAGGQEQIEDEHMCSMVKERLLAWKAAKSEETGEDALPNSILFYRDGVSESQFKMCIDKEIPQIRKAYRQLNGDGDTELKITFIIVSKRHHTRFFATGASQSYNYSKKTVYAPPKKPTYQDRTNGNLKPGLLVDSVVTNPAPYNFFLQSHVALQGTARPAHYHVLVDEMKLGGDIPELTLVLCTTFGRATKVVSYAAPAYIADRLCERGRVYLRPWQNSNMSPTWSPSDLKNNDGTPFTKDKLMEWRKAKALELAHTPTIWGNYQEAPGEERLNPWHPNFDNCMFWL